MKETLRQFLYLVRNVLDPLFNFEEVSILCYHSVSDSPHSTAVSPQTIQVHLATLAKRGYVFVSLADIVLWMDGKRVLPRKAVALTFDDGYADFETAALPVLRAFNAPATLFMIGEPQSTGWRLDQEPPFLTPEALERLRMDSLVELGYHSRTHPNLEILSGEALMKEVRLPSKARFFAYPGGQYSPEAIEAVKKAGYAAAFSIKPDLVTKTSDRWLLPRNVILKDMTPQDVALRASKAIAWYRALWRLSR